MVDSIVQGAIVCAIVAAALVHASTKYLPAAWRGRIATGLRGHGALASKVASWYAPQAGCGDGCSNCSSSGPAEKSGACASQNSAESAAKTATEKHEHVITLHARPRP